MAIASPVASRQSGATDDQAAATEADRALIAAAAKGANGAVVAFLDADFSWTDADGITRNKTESLDNLAGTGEETDVQTTAAGNSQSASNRRSNPPTPSLP